jgi:hypothetical protein
MQDGNPLMTPMWRNSLNLCASGLSVCHGAFAPLCWCLHYFLPLADQLLLTLGFICSMRYLLSAQAQGLPPWIPSPRAYGQVLTCVLMWSQDTQILRDTIVLTANLLNADLVLLFRCQVRVGTGRVGRATSSDYQRTNLPHLPQGEQEGSGRRHEGKSCLCRCLVSQGDLERQRRRGFRD